MRAWTLLLGLALVTAGSTPARAGDETFSRPGGFVGGGFLGVLNDSDVAELTGDSLGFEVRGGYRFHRHFAVEGQLMYTHNIGGDFGVADVDLETVTGTVNLKGYLLPGRIQPYGLVGIGGTSLHAEADVYGTTVAEDTAPAGVGGLSLTLPLPLAHPLARQLSVTCHVPFDRHVWSFSPSGLSAGHVSDSFFPGSYSSPLLPLHPLLHGDQGDHTRPQPHPRYWLPIVPGAEHTRSSPSPQRTACPLPSRQSGGGFTASSLNTAPKTKPAGLHLYLFDAQPEGFGPLLALTSIIVTPASAADGTAGTALSAEWPVAVSTLLFAPVTTSTRNTSASLSAATEMLPPRELPHKQNGFRVKVNSASSARSSRSSSQPDRRQPRGAKVALRHNLGLGGAAVVTMYRKAEERTSLVNVPTAWRDDYVGTCRRASACVWLL